MMTNRQDRRAFGGFKDKGYQDSEDGRTATNSALAGEKTLDF